MSKFINLALLPRDLSNRAIPYHDVVFISEDGSHVKVKRVIFDHLTWSSHAYDRVDKSYPIADLTAQKYLISALERKPGLLADLTRILASQPEILAAIQPCATHDSERIDIVAEDTSEAPSTHPELSALGSQES